MASTAQKREWYAPWACAEEKMVRVSFPGSPTANWSLLVADVTRPAWELFASLMREHSYYFRESAGGTYNCRDITGGNKLSLHAYGIALDLNPSVNRYGQTSHDFPQAFIDDVLETGLFRWGISFDDPMHFEIDLPPDELEDVMAFTSHEESILKQIVAALDEVDSNGTFAKYTVQHLRNHPKTAGLSADDVKAIVNDSQIVAPE